MSNSSSTASASSGVGFLGLLTIVLVILKALGYIHISWLMCFLPVIIGWSIALIILAVVFVVVVVLGK